jgi:hypothetical protein
MLLEAARRAADAKSAILRQVAATPGERGPTPATGTRVSG